MKIAILHMTMGLTTRGSEVVIDTIATELSKTHNLLLIQSGPISQKPYHIKRVYPQSSAPAVAPRSIWDKLLFRLHLDAESGAVVQFTHSALPLLSDFDPDIIVAINGSLQIRLLQGLALKAKIVAFGHAGIGHHDAGTLKAAPDLFVALTPAALDWATQIARSQTRVVYIPNPLKSVKPKSLNLNLPSPVVLTVSALSKYKNVDKVASALNSLPYSWLLIGDGEEHSVIEDQLSSFAGDFRWIKELDQSEIGAYYQSADIFCFVPDSHESFGMVYLEAMSSGLPIVATDDRVRRDLIGRAGIYVDPHDSDSIAAGIHLAHQRARHDYSLELKPFALKTVIAQLDKEFHDLIS